MCQFIQFIMFCHRITIIKECLFNVFVYCRYETWSRALDQPFTIIHRSPINCYINTQWKILSCGINVHHAWDNDPTKQQNIKSVLSALMRHKLSKWPYADIKLTAISVLCYILTKVNMFLSICWVSSQMEWLR
jgi:hypothetical protein